jgi:hypothetical protein
MRRYLSVATTTSRNLRVQQSEDPYVEINGRRHHAAASPETAHDDAIAIGLMCKPPRPGITKTRLAATIGADFAAELSECFLRDVAQLIAGLEVSCRVQGYGLYTPVDAAAEIRALLPASFRLAPQEGNDFSAVVHHAVAGLLE